MTMIILFDRESIAPFLNRKRRRAVIGEISHQMKMRRLCLDLRWERMRVRW